MWVKFVAQPFSLRCSFDQSGDIHELESGGNNDLRFGNPGTTLSKRGIWHRDDADVGINRAKRIIGRLGFARAGDRVKERAFANIRETNYSSFEHKRGLSERAIRFFRRLRRLRA